MKTARVIQDPIGAAKRRARRSREAILLRPQPMAPAEVSDLIARTRRAMQFAWRKGGEASAWVAGRAALAEKRGGAR